MRPGLLPTAARTLSSKKYRPLIAVAILLATIVLIARFFVIHPHYLSQLRQVRLQVVALVILLYALMVGVLVWMYESTLALCGRAIPVKEQALLTSYSTIINFFGPLQSGPGVRAVYLKTQHGVRLRDYTLASLLYYGLFASFSALFLLVGTRPWWQTTLALLAVAGGSTLVIRWFLQRDGQRNGHELQQFALRGRPLASLMAATFLQVVLMALIFFVELKAVNPHIHFSQALSYTGAANFALFVALTPGAIGFRETFLVFSEHIHHVSTANILAANVIDRGAYIIFLLLLFGFVVSVHAKDKLRLKGPS